MATIIKLPDGTNFSQKDKHANGAVYGKYIYIPLIVRKLYNILRFDTQTDEILLIPYSNWCESYKYNISCSNYIYFFQDFCRNILKLDIISNNIKSIDVSNIAKIKQHHIICCTLEHNNIIFCIGDPSNIVRLNTNIDEIRCIKIFNSKSKLKKINQCGFHVFYLENGYILFQMKVIIY